MGAMRKDVQAKHISDVAALRPLDPVRWSTWWVLAEELFPGLPPKVVLAKYRRLIRRKVISGCACGCRGDFTLLPKGQEILARAGG